MALYNTTEAYDLSLFEEQIVKQKIEPIRIKKEPPQQKRNDAGRKNTDYALKIRVALKASVFAVVCLTCIALMLFGRAQSDELSREITKLENDIKIAQGENVRLNTALNSLISADRVEAYAEDVLKMVKAENYQITYINMSKGDMIVLSGDKTDLKEKLAVKLKELFAYPP